MAHPFDLSVEHFNENPVFSYFRPSTHHYIPTATVAAKLTKKRQIAAGNTFGTCTLSVNQAPSGSAATANEGLFGPLDESTVKKTRRGKRGKKKKSGPGSVTTEEGVSSSEVNTGEKIQDVEEDYSNDETQSSYQIKSHVMESLLNRLAESHISDHDALKYQSKGFPKSDGERLAHVLSDPQCGRSQKAGSFVSPASADSLLSSSKPGASVSGLNLTGRGISGPSSAGKSPMPERTPSALSPRPDSPASRSGCDPIPVSDPPSNRKKKKIVQAAKAYRKPVKLVIEPVSSDTLEKQQHGILEQGVLVVSPKSPDQAYVRIPGKENDDVNIGGIQQRNRAFNGDVVKVEILPRSEWKVRPECIEEVQVALGLGELHGCSSKKAIQSLIQSQQASGKAEFSNGKSTAASKKPPNGPKESQNQGKIWTDLLKDNIGIDAAPDRWLQKTGKVVQVVDAKGPRQLVGILCPVSGDAKTLNGARFLLEPSDPRMPSVFIREQDIPVEISKQLPNKKALKKELFLVEATEWKEGYAAPFGTIVKHIGPVGDVASYTATVLVENGVLDHPCPEDLEKLIKSFKKLAAEKEPGRHDFRGDCVFTIDPPDAKDLDDAVSCSDLGNGVYRVGVHIADVSFFISEGSPLDLHARQRGTSVYLVNQVVSMLPTKLIESCCSLDVGKDRRTVSVILTITESGEILDCHITRGLIRSRAKLSYRTAQDIIDSPSRVTARSLGVHASDADEIRRTVISLHYVTQALRRERFEKGGLRIDQPEFSYLLDDKGLPVAMYEREHWASCQLIEELALLTNMISAKTIYDHYPEIALLRRHPSPQRGPLCNMQKVCHQENLNMSIDTAKSIQVSMASIIAQRPELHPVLSYLCAKPMKLAEYVCTGIENDTWHFALDVDQYTHMTSPIRRYPDIIVHRLLLAALGYTPAPVLTTSEVQEIAGQCNDRKLSAGRCQEASLNLFMGLFIQRFGPLREDGVVVAVYGASLSVDILVPRLAFVQRVFCAKSPGVKAVRHCVRGGKHMLEVVWSTNGLVQTLAVLSDAKVLLSVENDLVRNVKMSLRYPY